MERGHTHIGTTKTGTEVWLSARERLEHQGILGASGVGKSVLLERLAAQDMARGDGLLLLDPHGPLAEAVLSHVPAWRHNHVCYLNIADLERPIAMNFLEDVHPDLRALVVDGVVSAMRAIWTSWGPRMEQILRHAATALIEVPNASLVLLPRLLTDDAFRARIAPRISDPLTRGFFEQRFEKWRDTYREEAIDPVLNKVESFLAFPAVRNILGQGRSTLDLNQAMARGRIVIVNLAKSKIGETAAHLMGALLLANVLSRLTIGQERDFNILIDEAHNFGNIAPLIREARKFKVSVTAATQQLAGLNEDTRAALLGAAHTLICFRLGVEDAELLAPSFSRAFQDFNPYVLQHLDRGEAVVRSGSNDAALVDMPLPDDTCGNADTAKKQSRLHYANRRDVVERNILKALGHSQ